MQKSDWVSTDHLMEILKTLNDEPVGIVWKHIKRDYNDDRKKMQIIRSIPYFFQYDNQLIEPLIRTSFYHGGVVGATASGAITSAPAKH